MQKIEEKVDKKEKDVNIKVLKFFNENKEKFRTKRQASKYLMGFGKVYKTEHEILLGSSKRGTPDIPLTLKSGKKKVVKKGKK